MAKLSKLSWQSCAMKHTSFFGCVVRWRWGSTSGGFSYETESVEDRYYWNCGAAAGEGYSVPEDKEQEKLDLKR